MKYILRVIDFETTGIPDDETSHSVVEAASAFLCGVTVRGSCTTKN